ncbi:hypothetical protein E1295_15160 [Nonomuraea mesophila]|uniref:Peptidase inhibitor family I36 n=1 Tax=Nonomuraea mesophila TaxID=2530382 RepID=A0A4R5FNE5_9ACTN|nr:peptidase inhibitor family I36 protein [Nonomuraea mesophila]TDE54471.1 hypothetical protein E1295_15160 [Nonomuraea mesophila]
MKKAVIRTLLVMGVVTGVSGISPSYADARAAAEAGSFCLYEHDDYKGGYFCINGSDVSLRKNYWVGTSRSVNNGASSMKNNTGYIVMLHDLEYFVGQYYLAKPGSSDKDLTNNSGNPSYDNKATSLEFR